MKNLFICFCYCIIFCVFFWVSADQPLNTEEDFKTLENGLPSSGLNTEKVKESETVDLSKQDRFRVILSPLYHVKIASRIEGVIKEVNTKIGSYFDKGDLLIQIDDIVYSSIYEKAKAQVEKTLTRLEARTKLFERDMSSQVELIDAKADYVASMADLTFSQDSLAATKVIAPFNGYTQEVYVEPFETIQKNTPLIEIIDSHILIAKMILPSTLIKTIRIEDKIDMKILETDEIIQAKIKRIAASIDPSSSTIRIEAEIDNSDNKLRAGMTGEVILGDWKS